MKISLNWLRRYVDIPVTVEELCDRMVMAGFEVEDIEDLSQSMENVVAARILRLRKHPDADKLQLCGMDVGSGTPIQIITGADNVFEGALVPAALHDSRLPNGTHIKRGKLRGLPSEGMLCSGEELCLGEADYPGAEVDGILILREDAAPGTDMREILGLDDVIIDFKITANRPDCQSVLGVAREVSVALRTDFHPPVPAYRTKGGDIREHIGITVEDYDLCPRYLGRVVKNLRIAPSPKWMQASLRAAGMRPINNIVDITNFVMLETGQPMHAFDLRDVRGARIIVRRARPGEPITTLDGRKHTLTNDMLVIADADAPSCLAGIMGGENSEIVSDTVDVVFESANFDGTCIRKGALSLGMRTEASAKFEKGLDPLNTLPAVNRACELVEMLGAGEVVDGVIDIVNNIPEPTVLALRPDKINALLGTDVSTETMQDILRSLQFGVDGETISVPSWRGDVGHYSDLAEEVARFYGYNNIPCTLVSGESTLGGYSDEQLLEQRLGSLCRAAGYDEIITYSFISPTYYDKIRMPADSPERESFKILNPLGEDTSIMRTTTLPSMLEILTRNYNFRNKEVKLYELGRTYHLGGKDGLAIEKKYLTLGTYGAKVNFFTVKGLVEAIMKDLRAESVRFEACTDNPSYHPGRCATVWAGDECIGVFGQIHPLVAANYGVDTELYCAELSLEKLLGACGPDPIYTPLPKFPAVTRDIAVVCDKAIPVAKLIDCISKAGGKYLKGCSLFDIYTGSHIADGKKSVAFSLTLRADDQTLTDDHAEETMKAVLDALERDFGASMR